MNSKAVVKQPFFFIAKIRKKGGHYGKVEYRNRNNRKFKRQRNG